MVWQSLQKLLALPDETIIHCSHEYTQENSRFAIKVDPDNEALQARIVEVDRLRAAGTPTVPFTLAVEKQTNPFLRPNDKKMRKHLGMENATDEDVFVELRRLRDL